MNLKINPTVLLVTILSLGILLTFTRSVWLNLVIIIGSSLYLVFNRPAFKKILLIGLFVLPLAFGTWWSFIVYGTGDTWHNAWIFSTRIYAYVWLGIALTLTNSVDELLFSLVQNIRLSATFAYGILATFNLLNKIRRQVKIIRYAGQVRGITYHFWQPQLYFKAIIVALTWSGDLAEAMTSHGFSEGFSRSHYQTIPLPLWQWLIPISVLALSLSFLVICQPW